MRQVAAFYRHIGNNASAIRKPDGCPYSVRLRHTAHRRIGIEHNKNSRGGIPGCSIAMAAQNLRRLYRLSPSFACSVCRYSPAPTRLQQPGAFAGHSVENRDWCVAWRSSHCSRTSWLFHKCRIYRPRRASFRQEPPRTESRTGWSWRHRSRTRRKTGAKSALPVGNASPVA